MKDNYFHFSIHATQKDQEAYNQFVEENKEWLDDYALFCALKNFYSGACWWNWSDEGHRHHHPDALTQFRQRSDKKYCLDQYYFEQFAFFTQWRELKEYAKENGVYLFGDMPFFVARDSVEVWAHPEYFLLDEQGNSRFLAGVPPENDYFQPGKGQCWGYPLYNWSKLKEEWWLKRFDTISRLFDMVRLTHFRGFHRCWAIYNTNTDNPNPADGEWHPVPGEALFAQFQKWNTDRNCPLTVVVEDIGAPEEVIKLRDQFKFYGIKLLQIAFDLEKEETSLRNYHLPHYYTPRDIAYTGTHDSNTIVGWSARVKEDEKRRKHICEYLDTTPEKMPKSLIQAAFQSCAKLAIIPMQDILSLGHECRMNTPGTSEHNNWRWQFSWRQVSREINPNLRELVKQYERK